MDDILSKIGDTVLEPIKGMIGKFIDLSGDPVDMSLIEMGIYTIVPFGQLIMRVQKFGGSLDKVYLFFPLFFIPPFSIVPVLFAKFGFLHKSNVENIIDPYIIIPIIFRFILIFGLALFGNFGGPLLQAGLVLVSLIAVNMYRSSIDDNCIKSDAPNMDKTIKNVADSMAQYSMGLLTVSLIYMIPFINLFLDLIGSIPFPIVGHLNSLMNPVFWSIGLAGGYVLVHMYDAYITNKTEACASKIDSIRTIVSVVAFAISLFLFRKD